MISQNTEIITKKKKKNYYEKIYKFLNILIAMI